MAIYGLMYVVLMLSGLLTKQGRCLMLRVEQEFNINTNNDAQWSIDNDLDARAIRDHDDHMKARTIASMLHNPEMGVHAECYESLTGWAVRVIHNTITHGDIQKAA